MPMIVKSSQFQSAPRLGAAENAGYAAHAAKAGAFQSAPRLGAAENRLALNSVLTSGDSLFSANRRLQSTCRVPIIRSRADKSSLFKELSWFAKPSRLRGHSGFAEGIIGWLLYKFMLTLTLSKHGSQLF